MITLDLPSHGRDIAQLANIKLDDDLKKVTDAANAIAGKVILVGHSSGGVVISQAAEMLGTQKIDKLIYLDAFLPQNDESVLSLVGKISESNNTSSTSKSDKPKPEFGSWFLIVGRADKNKENNSLPRKWAAFKVLRLF